MYGRIPDTYANGGWVEGGLVEMEKLESASVLTPENRRRATMSVRQKVMVFRDSTGKSVDTAELTGWPG